MTRVRITRSVPIISSACDDGPAPNAALPDLPPCTCLLAEEHLDRRCGAPDPAPPAVWVQFRAPRAARRGRA